MKQTDFPSDKLKTWFSEQKRNLPWRTKTTPYRVWVSEVMLQQTLASVVTPYFERWMQHFPTIKALAEAPIEKVIKQWEGLGYYSRARNLHEGAKYLVSHHNGELPDNSEDLQKIKGLGPYTVGAILSFAFHKKVPAVDGNVLRVLARYFNLHDDIAKGTTQKMIRQLAGEILPDEEPWIVSEGLIELGATVCKKQPLCRECPIRQKCQGFLSGTAELLPNKTKAKTGIKLTRAVAVIVSKNHVLLKKGRPGEIMHDLYEFPYFDTTEEGVTSDGLKQMIDEAFALKVSTLEDLPKVVHTFTKYRVSLFPTIFSGTSLDPIKNHEWLNVKDLKDIPFSSGHRRVYQSYFLT